MSYDTVTLATVAYTRVTQKDDTTVLNSANSTFEVPEQLQLKRALPKPGASNPVLRGSIKTSHSWKDSITGKIYTVLLETVSSCPVQIPSATLATALDRHQAAIANEALATDVLVKGIIY